MIPFFWYQGKGTVGASLIQRIFNQKPILVNFFKSLFRSRFTWVVIGIGLIYGVAMGVKRYQAKKLPIKETVTAMSTLTPVTKGGFMAMWSFYIAQYLISS